MSNVESEGKITYSFRLPYCILLADGDYYVKTEDNQEIVICLKKKIPESSDERVRERRS